MDEQEWNEAGGKRNSRKSNQSNRRNPKQHPEKRQNQHASARRGDGNASVSASSSSSSSSPTTTPTPVERRHQQRHQHQQNHRVHRNQNNVGNLENNESSQQQQQQQQQQQSGSRGRVHSSNSSNNAGNNNNNNSNNHSRNSGTGTNHHNPNKRRNQNSSKRSGGKKGSTSASTSSNASTSTVSSSSSSSSSSGKRGKGHTKKPTPWQVLGDYYKHRYLPKPHVEFHVQPVNSFMRDNIGFQCQTTRIVVCEFQLVFEGKLVHGTGQTESEALNSAATLAIEYIVGGSWEGMMEDAILQSFNKPSSHKRVADIDLSPFEVTATDDIEECAAWFQKNVYEATFPCVSVSAKWKLRQYPPATAVEEDAASTSSSSQQQQQQQQHASPPSSKSTRAMIPSMAVFLFATSNACLVFSLHSSPDKLPECIGNLFANPSVRKVVYELRLFTEICAHSFPQDSILFRSSVDLQWEIALKEKWRSVIPLQAAIWHYLNRRVFYPSGQWTEYPLTEDQVTSASREVVGLYYLDKFFAVGQSAEDLENIFEQPTTVSVQTEAHEETQTVTKEDEKPESLEKDANTLDEQKEKEKEKEEEEEEEDKVQEKEAEQPEEEKEEQLEKDVEEDKDKDHEVLGEVSITEVEEDKEKEVDGDFTEPEEDPELEQQQQQQQQTQEQEPNEHVEPSQPQQQPFPLPLQLLRPPSMSPPPTLAAPVAGDLSPKSSSPRLIMSPPFFHHMQMPMMTHMPPPNMQHLPPSQQNHGVSSTGYPTPTSMPQMMYPFFMAPHPPFAHPRVPASPTSQENESEHHQEQEQEHQSEEDFGKTYIPSPPGSLYNSGSGMISSEGYGSANMIPPMYPPFMPPHFGLPPPPPPHHHHHHPPPHHHPPHLSNAPINPNQISEESSDISSSSPPPHPGPAPPPMMFANGFAAPSFYSPAESLGFNPAAVENIPNHHGMYLPQSFSSATQFSAESNSDDNKPTNET